MNAKDFDEVLLLAGVDLESTRRQARIESLGKRAKPRLTESVQLDPRVVKYVTDMDAAGAAVSVKIEELYALANAASSLDPITAGGMQERAGVLMTALADFREAVNVAKRAAAVMDPRAVTPVQ